MVRKILLTTATAIAGTLAFTATPASAQQACDINGVAQAPPVGTDTLQCGTGGLFAFSTGANGTAVGVDSNVVFDDATAIGANSFAGAIGSASASAVAGYIPPTGNDGATAVGSYSYAAGLGTVAIGDEAGVGLLTADGSGSFSLLAANSGTAIGSHSTVTAVGGTALGYGTSVSGANSTAIGNGASDGGFLNSVALGAGTTNTADNQVNVGGRSISGVNPGVIALASTDAVNGAQLFATNSNVTANSFAIAALAAVDVTLQANITAEGVTRAAADAALAAADVTLQTNITAEATTRAAADTAIIAVNTTQTGQITVLQTSDTAQNTAITAIQTVNTTQATQITAIQALNTTQDNRLTALEAVSLDFGADLDRVDRRASAGTAVAIAMGGTNFLPDKKFNLSGSFGTYRGAHAGALNIGAMISPNAALNAGVATGFNKGGKIGARVGMTWGW